MGRCLIPSADAKVLLLAGINLSKNPSDDRDLAIQLQFCRQGTPWQ